MVQKSDNADESISLGQITPNFTIVGDPAAFKLSEFPPVVPILASPETVIFPLVTTTLLFSENKARTLLNDVAVGDRLMAIVSLIDPSEESNPANFYHHATLVYVHRLFKGKEGLTQVIFQGIARIEIKEIVATEPYARARIGRSLERGIDENDTEGEALIRHLKEQFSRLITMTGQVPENIATLISNTVEAKQLVYLIAGSIKLEFKAAQEILSLDSVKEKARRLVDLTSHEIEVLELGKKISSEARSEMEKTQREYILRQQLKAIQNELGDGSETVKRADEFRKKMSELNMPPEAKRETERELSRLESMQPASAEYPIIETYLEWMTELPWNTTSEESLNIEEAEVILEADHYGLGDIKARILEYLSVRKLRSERHKDGEQPPTLRPEREGAIICFVGPPGVGKTSLGASIARALNRKFIRLSLGGLRDEAEIRGHRRTYIGAAPGRIIQLLRRVGTKNPVMMLDEIDKVGSDWRGDPSSALLEVLDPEQNRDFRDNYLNVPFDLSQVLFISTANVLDTIPAPLRDRMEVIELTGYTDSEKLNIAKRYLVPRQLRENGLLGDELLLTDDALSFIIQNHTREAGVRELERQIGKVCRHIATSIVKNESSKKEIDADDVGSILGKPRFYREAKERTDTPGVAIGLAYTPVGGDILFIEATRTEGNLKFSITGQLGEVMKESAQAAFTLVRARAGDLGLSNELFTKSDVHLHVPAGAIQKDGPSAGIAMTVALASLFSERPVKADTGMTGEITLRGKVLPVGGIKEKLIAAHRSGLRWVLIPKHNEKDLEELPIEVRNDLEIILVDHIDQVLYHTLGFDFPERSQSARHHNDWDEKHALPHH
jgi:ATP-dependent Lon protease